MDNTTITAIAVLIGAILGSGGMVAIIHEFSIHHKVRSDAKKAAADIEKEREQMRVDFEKERSDMFIDVQKYCTEEMKRMTEGMSQRLADIQSENADLKREICVLNNKLSDLVKWVMYDNATHRTWLEKTLRELDPNIDIPECPEPPIVFGNDNNDYDSSSNV